MNLAAPLIFYEGEDEAAILSRFVELSAKYTSHNCFQVAEHTFKSLGLKDPVSRANQAATTWANDLEVLERIEKAKRNGGEEPEPALTKEEWQREMLALVRNENIGAQSKAAMIKGMEAYAQSEGWIVKAVEKKTEKTTASRVQVIMAQANDG